MKTYMAGNRDDGDEAVLEKSGAVWKTYDEWMAYLQKRLRQKRDNGARLPVKDGPGGGEGKACNSEEDLRRIDGLLTE